MTKIRRNSSSKLCCETLFAVLALFIISFQGTVLAAPQDQAGQTLFKSNCATCHSQSGAPTAVGKSLNAPDLGSEPVQNHTNAQLQQTISNGKGNMPAFKDKLSPAEVNSLAAYVLTLSKRHK
jgi:cytochrome c6